jgi:hypothetical protein
MNTEVTQTLGEGNKQTTYLGMNTEVKQTQGDGDKTGLSQQ